MGGSFYYKREQKHLENKPMVSRFAKNKNKITHMLCRGGNYKATS